MVSLVVFAAAACAASAARVESGTLPVAGGGLYYEVAGSGDPVVLIHGGFGDRRMWDDQFDVLARDYRVLRYDHRGFGRSIERRWIARISSGTQSGGRSRSPSGFSTPSGCAH
jgi:pimeloyl-ACP methyl ester carboxylesterase